MGQGLGVGDVVDRNDLNPVVLAASGAEHIPPDPPESIDADSNAHALLLVLAGAMLPPPYQRPKRLKCWARGRAHSCMHVSCRRFPCGVRGRRHVARRRKSVTTQTGSGSTARPQRPPPPTGRARGEVLRGPVVYVSDGDTIGVRLNGVVTRIQWSVSTLRSQRSKCAGGMFRPKASAIAQRLLPRGTSVTVVTDPTQDRHDKYNRLLAYVFTANNPVSVNEQLVSEGAARVYVYRRRHHPRRLGKLRAAERQAKAAGRGLWSACPTAR